VTVPAATPTADANRFGLATYAGPSGAWAAGFPTTYSQGQVIVLDPAGAFYAAIGTGNLRAWVQGTDDVSHTATGN
jgi:hypothetical protein